MKRIFALFLALVFPVALCACESIQVRTYNGGVLSYGEDVFELACEDGKVYGFLVTEDTTMAWEDSDVLEELNAEDWQVWEVWDRLGDTVSVSVTAGEETQCADSYTAACAERWFYAKKITVVSVDEDMFDMTAKPVIYLYPEVETAVEVTLDYDGALTCTYPAYENAWQVTAYPDGTLTDSSGQSYNYLYWEGISPTEYDFSRGFCVAGADTAAFLEGALEELGLSRREANEFIVYWLPLMEQNPYNLIAFQTKGYTDHARLTVEPQPDTVIRVFMAWQGLNGPVEILPQQLDAPQREGFVVVEWGGTEVTE